MSSKDKEYFQVILDRKKEHEKKYIDILDELINERGLKKRDILLLALDNISQEKLFKSAIQEVVKEEKKEIIEEIKDLKLMIKAIASGNIAFTIDNEEIEEDNHIEIDTSGITEDDLNF